MSAQFWNDLTSLQDQYRSAGSSKSDQQALSPSQHRVTEVQDIGGEAKTSKKAKRFRVAFNDMQLTHLENEFKRSSYMHTVRRLELSKRLNLSERTIKVWFQNRRMKEKRERTKYDPEVRDVEDMGQNDFIVNLRYNEHYNDNKLMYESDKVTENAEDDLSRIKIENNSDDDSSLSPPMPEEQIERSSGPFMSIADFKDVTKITRPYSGLKKLHINTNDGFHSKYIGMKSQSNSPISPTRQIRPQIKTFKTSRREMREQGRGINTSPRGMSHSRNIPSTSMSSRNQINKGPISSQSPVHPDFLRYYPSSYNLPGNPYNISPILPPRYINRPTGSGTSHDIYQLPASEEYTTCEGPSTPALNCHCACHKLASSVGPGPFPYPPYPLPYMQFMPPMPPGSNFFNVKKQKP